MTGLFASAPALDAAHPSPQKPRQAALSASLRDKSNEHERKIGNAGFPLVSRKAGGVRLCPAELHRFAVQHSVGIHAAAAADRRLSAGGKMALWLFALFPAFRCATDPRPHLRLDAGTGRRGGVQGAAQPEE